MWLRAAAPAPSTSHSATDPAIASAHDPTADAADSPVVEALDELVQGRDYEIDAAGRWTFLAGYLTRRGFCCFLGCRHCPHGQAGRIPAQAQADLSRRLLRLGERLRAHGLPPLRLAYRDGVLHVARIAGAAPGGQASGVANAGPPDSARDDAALSPRIMALARAELTVQQVLWG